MKKQNMTKNVTDISTAELKELIDSYFDSTITPEGESRLRQVALARLAGTPTALPEELDADLRLIASLAAMAGAEQVSADEVEVPAALSARWNDAVAQAAARERAVRRRPFVLGKMARRWIASAASVAVVALIGWQLVSDGGGVSAPPAGLTAKSLTIEVPAGKKAEPRSEMAETPAAVATAPKQLAAAAPAPRPKTIASVETAPEEVSPEEESAATATVFYPATATLPADHDSRYRPVAQAVDATSDIISEIEFGGIQDLVRISDALEDLFTTPVPAEEEEPKFIQI